MAKILKFFFKFFAVLFLLLLVIAGSAYFLISSSYVSSSVTSFIERTAAQNGVQVKVHDLKINAGGSASASEITAYLNRLFFGIRVTDVKAAIVPSALLKRRFSAAASASAYNGSVATDADYAVFDERGLLNLKIADLELSNHEQVAALGITRGNLNLELNVPEFTPGSIKKASARLTVKDLHRAFESVLPIAVPSLNQSNISIPKFTVDRLELSAALNGDKLTVDQSPLRSSLGNAIISGSGNLINWSLRSYDVNIKANLSDEGVTHIGPYLPLITKGALIPENRCFSCSISMAHSSRTAVNCAELQGSTCDL